MGQKRKLCLHFSHLAIKYEFHFITYYSEKTTTVALKGAVSYRSVRFYLFYDILKLITPVDLAGAGVGLGGWSG